MHIRMVCLYRNSCDYTCENLQCAGYLQLRYFVLLLNVELYFVKLEEVPKTFCLFTLVRLDCVRLRT